MCIIGGVDPQRHARSKSAKSTHRRALISPFALFVFLVFLLLKSVYRSFLNERLQMSSSPVL